VAVISVVGLTPAASLALQLQGFSLFLGDWLTASAAAFTCPQAKRIDHAELPSARRRHHLRD
jgi:hypothetical protein